jgi:SAM-dependent methyltransferase
MPDRDERAARVDAHYGSGDDPAARILDRVRARGKDPEALTLDDLAPFDQFHSGGRDATRELAKLAGIGPETSVLDVGGGLGGPARTLASEFGCTVTVLDLTEAFCPAGEALTARVGLAGRVHFRHGDALAMPFGDAAFDLAWTQHSSMNIPDKDQLYREVHRVLRPNGRLALHEIMAGPVQPPRYPVLWAKDQSISFLRPAADIRALLTGLGFREVAWIDTSDATASWWRESAARMEASEENRTSTLSGADILEPIRNVIRNFDEDRIVVVEAVLDRP